MTTVDPAVSSESLDEPRPMAPPSPLPDLAELERLFELRDGLLVRRIKRAGYATGTPAGSRSSDGYWSVKIGSRQYLVHRIVWALANERDPWPMQIDHIDGNRSNNRPENLRLATPTLNAANRPAKGYHRVGSGYQARIQQQHIGYFTDEQSAADAYRAERIRRFGEFAHAQ